MLVVTRQPLVGLALAAVGGILLSPLFSVGIWMLESIGVLILWQFFRKSIWILLATGGVFACFHRLQTIESPAALLSASLAREPSGKIWDAQGIVSRVFRSSRGISSLIVQTKRLHSDKSHYDFPLQVLVPWHGKPPSTGSTIHWKGSLRSTQSSWSSTGGPAVASFRRQTWLNSLGIYLEFYKITGTGVVLYGSSLWHPRILAKKLRQRAEQGITRGIEDRQKETALIRALMFGADQETEKILAEFFRRTGTYHVFSVSGLHVGMLGAIAWQTLKVLRIPQPVALPLIISLLISYAGITGFRPPALRATCMAVVFLCGIFAKRRAFVLNSLAAAALCILCWDSKQLFYPGFQLSFVVVATIALLTPLLYKGMHCIFSLDPFLPRRLLTPSQRISERLGCGISATLAVSISAWLGSTPLLLWHFKNISLSALFINPLVVPLVFLVLNLAVLSLFCDLFLSTWLAVIFANANLLPTSAILGIVQWGSEIPGGFYQWD